MSTQRIPGLMTIASSHSVDATVESLLLLLNQRQIKLFALVDHSGEAAKAGLQLPPTKLLIFGNPRAGTPVMLAAPTIAIDLPLKLLVWQDSGGVTQLSFNDPLFLLERHRVPAELKSNISIVRELAEQAAG